MSETRTLTQAEIDTLLDTEVGDAARKALKEESGPVWGGIESFIKWLRTVIKDSLQSRLEKLPIIGRWASRISVSISEFTFSVIGTAMSFLRLVFTSPTTWASAHGASIRAWTANEANGLLAQIYAYSKHMSGFFLEIISQCLERAIVAHNLQVTQEEKEVITDMLNELLQNEK